MKLAVIADTHLPNCSHSAQEAALLWALGQCAREAVDLVAYAGDLTAAGEPGSGRRFFAAIASSPLPRLLTPGNSDLRTPSCAGALRAQLSKPFVAHAAGVCVVSLDSADGAVQAMERRRFEALLATVTDTPIVVVTHWTPLELPAADRDWLAALARRVRIEQIIAGHKHIDAETELAGVPVHLVRGLDPDKAKSAPPALCLFTRREGHWTRRDLPFANSDPRTWSPCQRNELMHWLGVSTMGRTLADTAAAAAAHAPCLEIRTDGDGAPELAPLRAAVDRWRSTGGRLLSLHLPNLRWDTEAERVLGQDTFAAAADLALALRADQVTVHVPRGPLALLQPEGLPRTHCLAAFCAGLSPLAATGITIGIENLHTNRGEATGDGRGFGYLPAECLGWIEALRQRLPAAAIGLLLDLGHARNNGRLAQSWTLGRWYAEAGTRVVGYHVHQVTEKGNHQPVANPFGPLLSLASFFWAWQVGQLRHAPLFLEIRDRSALESLSALRTFLAG